MSITWFAMAIEHTDPAAQPRGRTGTSAPPRSTLDTDSGALLECAGRRRPCETASAMADFFQNGVITTLHNLSPRRVEELEADLSSWSAQRPMSLVIPTLFSEVEGDALPAIVDELGRVEYLSEVIIGLDRADAQQYDKALGLFDALPMRHTVLWHDGPRMQAIDARLAEHGLAPLDHGKGRNVWYCLGYFLASS